MWRPRGGHLDDELMVAAMGPSPSGRILDIANDLARLGVHGVSHQSLSPDCISLSVMYE